MTESTYDLEVMDPESLRRLAARIAGLLAQKSTVFGAAKAYHRIADALITVYSPERSADA